MNSAAAAVALIASLSADGVFGISSQDVRSRLFADLTVPHEALPAGCELSPGPSIRVDETHIRGGLWGGLQINRNPWTGVDRLMTAIISERVAPPSRLPDGPPLNPAQFAEFRLHLADGIDASYAAFYFDSAANELVEVYGLEFPTAAAAIRFRRESRAEPRQPSSWAVPYGRILVTLFGHSDCARAVDSYLQMLQ
jgi:hypothetical protein